MQVVKLYRANKMNIKDIFKWAISLNLFPLWSQSDPINGELKPHVYGKRQTANGRFKLRISQNMNRK